MNLPFDFMVNIVAGWVNRHQQVVIELSTRSVTICDTTVSPDGDWMKQVARRLTDAFDGICLGKTHLIVDRDTKFTESFHWVRNTWSWLSTNI